MAARLTVAFSVLVGVSLCSDDLSFPPGFKFGAASSSYQIEGAWNVSDKGESIWDRLVHEMPDHIKDRSTGDIACDSYHKWEQDIEMLSDLGVHFYRFSISWVRLVPNGFTNKISEDGRNYYNKLINGLLAKGIEPIVTLYHFELPQRLQDLGGWANPLIADWFADYTRVVFSLFGDRVKLWLTINEPIILCEVVYNTGIIAPPYLMPEVAPNICSKNVMMAHAKAWRVYDEEFKPKYHGKVSIVNNLIWFEPYSESDEEVAEMARENMAGRYSHPIYSKTGDWPHIVKKIMAKASKKQGYPRSYLPSFTKKEIEFVKGTYDFYAINYYTSRVARKAKPGEELSQWPLGDAPDINAKLLIDPKWKASINALFYLYPEGLRRQLVWLKQKYGDLEFFITENGFPTGSGLDDKDRVISYKETLRELFVSSGVWVIYFLTGLAFGAPTVFIPQIRREANSTAVIDDEMASWLSSVFGYSAIPWVVILCILTRSFGRKIPIILVALNTMVFNILLYWSKTPTHILISEIMEGITYASNLTISVIVVSEYTSPKYRGMFLAIKSASLYWGVWVTNAIGTFFYWKYIPLVGMILSLYPFTAILWPESPQWLASKGRFDECRTAFRWLKGTSQKSINELENLVKSQKEYLKSRKDSPISFYNLKNYYTKAFYMPVFLSVVMMFQHHLSGKTVCVIYAIDIIKKITDSEETAYVGMLILDGVTVTGMYIGCFISKFVKRRTMLLTTSTTGIVFLCIISLYLYLVKLSAIDEIKPVTIGLLMLFSLSISCGPMILTTSIYGELTPLRYQNACMIITALTFVTLTSTVLKIAPFLFRTLSLHGTFLFYGLSSAFCTIILFSYLPETKDKTLQEIEEGFRDNVQRADEGEELLSVQNK